MNATRKYRRLSDVPMRTLRRWLTQTEQALGHESETAVVIRRAIARREHDELRDEIARLHEFILRLAERLANASDVLGMLAERREVRKA